MDAKGQLLYFCLCLGIGFVCGFVYEVFALCRALLGCQKGKHRLIEIFLDIVFFLVFAGICIYAGYVGKFPAFRVYMWLGYALGITIYLKILHRILAFWENVWYNKLTKAIEKARKKKKLSNVSEEKV